MPDDPRTLVGTGWLSERLGDDRLKIVDASWYLPAMEREARKEFEAGHIPGARFFDLDAVSDRESPLPHMLPGPDAFAAAAEALGVSNGDQVVVYDGIGLFSAPRLWWMFRVFGHDNVAVLDGGLPAWRNAGLPLESGAAAKERGRFSAAFRTELVADLEAVKAALEAGTPAVIDARPADRFAGTAPEPRAGLRSGHAPGSLNVPFTAVQSRGKLKEGPAIKEVFVQAGAQPEDPVIAQCGSGVTAAVIALALARLGRNDVAVYDGSWAEWGAREDLPVATD